MSWIVAKQENDVIDDDVKNCKSIHVEECRSIDWSLVITKPNDPLTKLMVVLVIFLKHPCNNAFLKHVHQHRTLL